MARALLLRRRLAAQVMRQPTAPAERLPRPDPRDEPKYRTLNWEQTMQLLRCIEIFGPDKEAYCRHEFLSEPPEFGEDPSITSPVPFGAAQASGGRRMAQIGRVAVTLLPDTTSTNKKMTGQAATVLSHSSNRPRITWTPDRDGRVAQINGPSDPWARIQTTYGPGASRTSRSSYGRGTTAPDKKKGDTSLGFHEGRHGVDYLRYMADNPFPMFTGKVGMAAADMRAAVTAYQDAVEAYWTEMERFSVENTDCVGASTGRSSETQVVCAAVAARETAARGTP